MLWIYKLGDEASAGSQDCGEVISYEEQSQVEIDEWDKDPQVG